MLHIFTRTDIRPFGILCPATSIPKLLLQEIWRTGISWDSPLPYNLQKEFSDWVQETAEFDKVCIPRYLEKNGNSELHVFMDACGKSYAACIS
ncbi:hypothetical protein HNY73_011877 [Argiope bruennichi]|uniref:Uncharacterized protein n=1 Tax=Argiope bruennichi TaxID=94029 RepID=A0A8T0EXZ7_ARGBR|nr:hypothetical protein HNY73_011877 [Argiope bruennichi]